MKKISLASAIVLAIIIVSVISSCLSNKTQPFILPPSKSLNIPFNSQFINPQSVNTLSYPGGSTVEIPANAFVDEKNQPVTQKVEITFREMKNAFDAMVSGIPMSYDSGGVKSDFTTAGMFEISGKSEGKPVYIAKNKTLTVNMTSKVKGNYNFYRLDTINKQWVYVSAGNTENTVNINKTNKTTDSGFINQLKIPKPVSPRKQSKKMIIFDFNVDYSAFPELAGFKDVVWEFLPEMNADTTKKELHLVYNTKWTDMQVMPFDSINGYYMLKLSTTGNQFNAIVVPVLSGKEYKKAMVAFKNKMKEYDILLEDKKLETQKNQNEDNFLRQYSIMSFGIYNWDCIYSRPDFVKMEVKFNIKNHPEINFKNLVIFHITDKDQAIIRYYPDTQNDFYYCPSDNNKLVVFLPGNKIAVFRNENFISLKKEIDENGKSRPCTIDLYVVDKNVNSLNDIIVNL